MVRWWRPYRAVVVMAAMAVLVAVAPKAWAGAPCAEDLIAGLGGTGEVVACTRKGGLVLLLVEDEIERQPVVALRIYGGDGPRWDQGERRLLLDDVLGEVPATFLRFGEKASLMVADFNADGLDEVAVATFSVNKNLFLYRLDPDPFEFLGRIFFTHEAGMEPQALLTALPVSVIDLGRTITVTRADGTYREYEATSPWDYTLIYDNRPDG